MTRDKWAPWLLTRRDGNSAGLPARNALDLAAFRDGVLEGVGLAADDVVLDVGCGTGPIGFGALDRLGPDGHVIFSDVSLDVLDECRRTASGDGRCSFVVAPADDLVGIADASVDVVTTRSVLIYSDRKSAAFAEFFRVLWPGGRISVFEPINGFVVRLRPDDLFGMGNSPVNDVIAKVRDARRAREAVRAGAGVRHWQRPQDRPGGCALGRDGRTAHPDLVQVQLDPDLQVMGMLVDRRDELGRARMHHQPAAPVVVGPFPRRGKAIPVRTPGPCADRDHRTPRHCGQDQTPTRGRAHRIGPWDKPLPGPAANQPKPLVPGAP
ncbi:class I SAM-dependent methyltransferase [Micromonospora avicenniae]|uniref:class I SAM-dependent methyltransferase n=1 Tax=Micromonospora avicenniae TaxID=1198245 RepID=UPI003328DE20